MDWACTDNHSNFTRANCHYDSMFTVIVRRDICCLSVTFHAHIFRNKVINKNCAPLKSACQIVSKRDLLNTIIYQHKIVIIINFLVRFLKGQKSVQGISENVGYICIQDCRMMTSFLCLKILDFHQHVLNSVAE